MYMDNITAWITMLFMGFFMGISLPLLLMASNTIGINGLEINLISEHTEDYNTCLEQKSELSKALTKDKTCTCNCPSQTLAYIWIPLYFCFGVIAGAWGFNKWQEYREKRKKNKKKD